MRKHFAWSARFRWALFLIIAVAGVLVPAVSAQAGEGGPKLTVLTRNIYQGTDLTNVVTATTFPGFVAAVTQDWGNVVATDFPARARALAADVRRVRPDVIGLQEVSLWRDQLVSDAVTGAPAPNATHVVYDFLAILQAKLATAGVPYTVVSMSTNADVEAPRINPASPNGFTDVRLTDRDVILVRTPLADKFVDPANGQYAVQLIASSPAGPVSFTRGWASIDYQQSAARRVRIFNTHLEVDAPPVAGQVQVAQGAEALGVIAASPYPVVALGDYNSDANGSTTQTYGLLTRSLTDAWATARPGDPGNSCCQAELLNSVQRATTRIDLVLTTGPWKVDRVRPTGGQPFRTGPAPLWASDHFGVTARLELPKPTRCAK